MDGTEKATGRRVLAGAIGLLVLAYVVVVAVRGVPDVDAGFPAPALPDDAAPVRVPRARAPEPAPLPPRSIRVAVTSMDGTPIPGARVELVRGPVSDSRFGDDAPPSVDAPKAERSAVAGDEGMATVGDVPPGRWFVVGSAPAFARHVLLGVTRDEGDAPVDASVVLEKGSAFAGTIRDPDGAPAAGVDVVLAPWSQWPNDAERLRTKTDARGAYRFDAVEAGRHSLWYSVRPGFLIEAARVMLPSLDGLDIRMTRGAAIDGVVRDAESGVAVPGARVFAMRYVESRISGLDGATTLLDVGITDHLGRFALRTWRTQTELSYLLVDTPGYSPTPIDESGTGPPGAVADGQRFAFDLRLRRAATLKGTVSGPDGPLAGLRVRARPQDDDEQSLPASFPWSCLTAADGSFRVDRVPAGTTEVSVHPVESGLPVTQEQDVELVAGEETTLDIRVDVQRVHVTRRVVDSKDRPVAGVEVVHTFGSHRSAARTDADGLFTIDALFAGDALFVELRSDRFRGTGLLNREDEDGRALFPPIPPESEVSGKLLRQDESPVAGARVGLATGMSGMHGEFFAEWDGLREAITGPDGTFRMPRKSGPDAWFAVSPWGGIEYESDDDGGTVRIALPDIVRVAGRAVAADGGEPVAGALLVDDYDRVIARAAADGRFAFDWWPKSRRALRATGDGWTPAPLDDGPAGNLVAMRRSKLVAGTVRTPDGAAARGLKVVVRASADTSEGEDWRSTSATDADGRFVVPGLAAGPCVVTVTDPVRHAVACVRATAAAGDERVAVVVRPGARLEVKVVEPDGDQVWGARVTARPTDAEVAYDEGRTAFGGIVEFGLATGVTYTLRVEHEKFETVEIPGVRGGGEPVRVVLKSKE